MQTISQAPAKRKRQAGEKITEGTSEENGKPNRTQSSNVFVNKVRKGSEMHHKLIK